MSRPPAPQPLPHPVVDGHTHLDHARRGEDAVDVATALAEAAAVGVTRMVQIGCDLEAARWTVRAVAEHDRLVGGVALHPTGASEIACGPEDPVAGVSKLVAAQVVSDQQHDPLAVALAEIERLAAHPRIRVVGETGLDHYWVKDSAGRAAQERSFRRHIALAKRLGKVMQIHDRDAHEDVLRVLHDEGAPEATVFHCFSGDPQMARHCAQQGWYLSFAGTLTFKNAEPLRQALRAVPLDQVLVETDTPYLAPMPYRGKTNAGYLVPLTVR
ncbi:MAG TPA: TatD family hydrolase, partial [Kineosporiaceae bacterium]|nr:TatD family hydrolase [Kineosporiaceae bacterium]